MATGAPASGPTCFSAREPGVDFVGLRQRLVARDRRKGVDTGLGGVERRKPGFGNLARRNLPGADQPRDLGCGQLRIVGDLHRTPSSADLAENSRVKAGGRPRVGFGAGRR